jgi:hypothetical protein
MCLGTDPSGRAIYGGDLLPLYLLGLRVRIPPGASIGLINVVYSQPSLRRADPSPRGVLPSCVCVCDLEPSNNEAPHTKREVSWYGLRQRRELCDILVSFWL